MDRSIADELYSDVLELSKLDLGTTSSATHNGSTDGDIHALSDGDDSIWDEADNEFSRTGERLRNQFHNAGYRDGLAAGKEASAQEGFNVGFKQSVGPGYNWGLVRGVTSALACLPDGLKDELVESPSRRERLHSLCGSVHALSTADAFKLFHGDITSHKLEQEARNSEANTNISQDHLSSSNLLRNYIGELKSLLSESPLLEVLETC